MKIEATPKELADFVSLLQNQKMGSNDKTVTVSEPQINLARMAKMFNHRRKARRKALERKDDNLKVIKNRFKIYEQETKPLLKYYAKQGKLITIDGRPSIALVNKKINALIKDLQKNQIKTETKIKK